jgi:hypothetical protein
MNYSGFACAQRICQFIYHWTDSDVVLSIVNISPATSGARGATQNKLCKLDEKDQERGVFTDPIAAATSKARGTSQKNYVN